jgi:hypothetical protein
MLDIEHRGHLGKYRSTLWKLHPITKIEVFNKGQWADLESVQRNVRVSLAHADSLIANCLRFL